MNRAEHKHANALVTAKGEKFVRVRQISDQVLGLPEILMKPILKDRQRQMRGMLVVKMSERQAKLGPKFIKAHRRAPRLGENMIGCRQDRRKIVHQRSRPIKNDIANHVITLATNQCH